MQPQCACSVLVSKGCNSEVKHQFHVQVRPGLFLGGAEGLCDAVNKNEIVPESVRWFCR